MGGWTLPPTPPSTPEPEVAQVTRVIENPQISSEAHIEFTGPTPDAFRNLLYLMPSNEPLSSSTQWPSFYAFGTMPMEEHLSAYGVQDMEKRARTMSRFEELPSSACLATTFQVATPSRDILNSDPRTLNRFTQCLVFIGLNLLRDYNSPAALKLLAKDQADLLRVFRDPQALLEPRTSAEMPPSTALHKISLVRSLFEFSNYAIDARPHQLDPKHTVNNNLNFYDSLVEVTDANYFENFDPAQMHDALLKSSVFKNDSHTRLLNTVA